MNRKQILNVRASQFVGALADWAKRQRGFKPEEQIDFLVSVGDNAGAQIKRIQDTNRGRKSYRIQRELAEQDWKEILTLPFSQDQKRLIRLFKRNGNEEKTVEEICEALDDAAWRNWVTVKTQFNKVFLVNQANYRLTGRPWRSLKFYAIGYK